VVEVPLLPNDLSGAVERIQHGDVLADRRAAAPAASLHFGDYEKPVAEVDQLLRLDSQRTPGAAPIGIKLK
jgi:hypothetical protein